MVKRRIFKSLAFLCAAAQLCALNTVALNGGVEEAEITVGATGVTAESGFDENDIVLTFGALSDVHIGYGTNTRLFHNALKYYQDNYELDALFFSGDLTQSGTLGEATEFIRIIEDHYDPAETPVMACYGNHDTFMYDDIYLDEYGFYDAFYAENSDLYNFDVSSVEQRRAGNRWTQVTGADGKKYDFVCAELATYGGTNTKFSSDTYTWLDETLATITTENPDRYVFVAVHSPSEDTVAGSYTVTGNMPGTVQTSEILNKYPQAVLFTGHTHFPMQDDLSINQDSYTQVHIGAESDLDLPAAVSNDRHDYSVGQVVEVDRNGYVRITRLDFMQKTQIREPWELLPCKADGSHLTSYRFADREAANSDPYFEEDAAISVEELASGDWKLTFDRAKDDMMIFSYDIEVTDASGNAVNVTITDEKNRIKYEADNYYKGMVDDFYEWPDPTLMPAEKSVLLKFASTPVYPLTISVVGYDAFGAYTPYGSDAKGTEALTLTVTDPTSANAQKAAAFIDAVDALGETTDITESDYEEILRLRAEYAGFDYKTKALVATKYKKFAELESYYYGAFYDLPTSDLTVAHTDTFLSSKYKGAVAQADNGVKLVWESAPANSLIGTKYRYAIDDLKIGFANLSYKSTSNRTFAVLLTGVRGDKWTDNESALIWVDMETGKVFYGDDVYLGRSEYFTADKIGGSPFEMRFAKQEDGSLSFAIDTVNGGDTFEIPARFVEDMTNFKDSEYVYIYFTPWSSRQSMQVDITKIA